MVSGPIPLYSPRVEEILSGLMLVLDSLGPAAYAVAPLLTAVVAILPIPAEVPAMVNGIVFGPVEGTVVTWTGALLGAAASFEISRALGRPVAERLISADALERGDRVVCEAGWTGLLVARFIPVVAFTAVNWGSGLTSISRWTFLWTTAVGILPGAVVFTASGAGISLLVGRAPAAVGLGAALLLAAILWRAWRRVRDRARGRRVGARPVGEEGA